MPSFQFRIVDPQGRIRKGTLLADDLDSARILLSQRGFEVLQVAPAEAPVVAPMPAPRSAPVYRPAFWERYSIPRSLRAQGFLALGLLGLFLLLAPASRQPPPPAPVVPLRPIHVEARGSVTGVRDFGDVTVTVEFPDIPLRQTWKWDELQHPRPDAYALNLAFQSPTSPAHLLVRLAKPGYREAVSPPCKLQEGSARLAVTTLALELSGPGPK